MRPPKGLPKAKAKAKAVRPKAKPKVNINVMHYRRGSYWIGTRRLRGINTFLDTKVLAKLKPTSKRTLAFHPKAPDAVVKDEDSKKTLSSYQRKLGGMAKGRYVHGLIKRSVDAIKKAKKSGATAKRKPASHPMVRLVFGLLSKVGLTILDCEKMVHWSRYRYGTAADILCFQVSKSRHVIIELKTGYKLKSDYAKPAYALRLDKKSAVSEQGRHFLQAYLTQILFEKKYPTAKDTLAYVLNVYDHTHAALHAIPSELFALRPALERMLCSA